MINHVHELAGNVNNRSGNASVAIAAYGVSLPPELTNAGVLFYPLPELTLLSKLPFLLRISLKLLLQPLILCFYLLFVLPSFRQLLVQTPPAIPTIFCAAFSCWFRSAKLIIDWHNYGFTMMEVNMSSPQTHQSANQPRRNALLRLAAQVEGLSGRLAHHHFCVSKAMSNDLRNRWSIDARVLYDCATDRFRARERSLWYDCRSELAEKYPEALSALSDKRCQLIVSPTSWGADESFNLLVDSVRMLIEKQASLPKSTDQSSAVVDPLCPTTPLLDNVDILSRLPPILFVLTGRGPLKEFYMPQFSRLLANKQQAQSDSSSLGVVSVWLESADYPKLLSVANLGLSFHASSSALDLPMKVVDMLACHLPVCALGFPCLSELLRDGENGFVFEGAEQLSELIVELTTEQEEQASRARRQLSRIRRNIASDRLSWSSEWKKVTRDIFWE